MGAWLSAGIDSSAVVALAVGLVQDPVATVSLGFEDPAMRRAPHRAHARTSSRATLSPTEDHLPVRGLRALSADALALRGTDDRGIEIPHMLLAEASGRGGKVVLVGEGSDEVFGGYRWFRNEKVLHRLGRLPDAVRLRLLAPLLRRWRPGPPASSPRRCR